MITKSMSNKNQDWGKTYDYITRDKSSQLYTWGMVADPYNKIDIVDNFTQNYQYIANNKRAKNTYYHEILSLPASSMSIEDQKKALYDLADQYISLRANGNLAVGSIHLDTDHPHMHLMISSNKYMDNKMTRHSKKDFKSIQQNVELYKNKTYPQLKTNHYQKQYKQKHKQKRVEQEINHKRNKLTKKQKVLQEFKQIVNNSKSKQELYHNLKLKNYTLYQRGKYYGLRDNSEQKNYRLRTLEENLDIKLVQRLKLMEQQRVQVQQQKAQVQKTTPQKQPTPTQGRYYGRK